MSEPEPLKHAISGNEDEESVDDPAKPAPSKLRQILASKKLRNGAALAAVLFAGTTLGAVLGTKAADAKKSESAAVEFSAAAETFFDLDAEEAEGAAAPEEEETTTDADKCEAIDALRKEGKAILPGGRRRRDLADRRDVAAEGGPANGPKIRGRRLEEEEAAKGEPATKKALERDLIFDLGADLEAQSMSLDYSASTVHSACGPETCGDGLECLEIPVFDKYACVTSRVVQCMVEDEAGAVDCCVEQV